MAVRSEWDSYSKRETDKEAEFWCIKRSFCISVEIWMYLLMEIQELFSPGPNSTMHRGGVITKPHQSHHAYACAACFKHAPHNPTSISTQHPLWLNDSQTLRTDNLNTKCNITFHLCLPPSRNNTAWSLLWIMHQLQYAARHGLEQETVLEQSDRAGSGWVEMPMRFSFLSR